MQVKKNRVFIGVISIIVAIILCLVVSPLLSTQLNETKIIYRVNQDVSRGATLSSDMFDRVEIAGEIPANSVTTEAETEGYAACDLVQGTQLLQSMVAESPIVGDEYLEELDTDEVAVAINVFSTDASVGNKLNSGDIVSLAYYDEQKNEKDGEVDLSKVKATIPKELTYVEVSAIVSSSSNDIKEASGTSNSEDDNTIATVIVRVNREQAERIIALESKTNLYFVLQYRGNEEQKAVYLKEQAKVFKADKKKD